MIELATADPILRQQKPTTLRSEVPELPPRIILASSSPRRRELLALLGIPFETVPSHYVEPPVPVQPVRLGDYVTDLATQKALDVGRREPDSYVIGADTLVTVDPGETGVPLGKPCDDEDARRMLMALSGQTHCVFTGVTVIRVHLDGTILDQDTAAVKTRVRFRTLDNAMIDDYIATGEPLDKAGAYGAQGYAAPFIEGFEGDFYNVVGLPLCKVGAMLETLGVQWWRHRKKMPPLIG